MCNSRTILSRLRPWLTLAAATAVAAGIGVVAQAPDTKSSKPAGPPSGNILGRVKAGKGLSVVWVDGTPGKTIAKPAKPPVISISQKGLRFVPHVMVVPVGASVDFLNGDDAQHNIFWPTISGNKQLAHSLGTWPKGETRTFQFTTAGIVPLLCNVHPEMSAYIIVTPTPYLAETDDNGSFEINGVPEGSYTLTAWHEGYKTQTKPVTVASNARIDFTLTK